MQVEQHAMLARQVSMILICVLVRPGMSQTVYPGTHSYTGTSCSSDGQTANEAGGIWHCRVQPSMQPTPAGLGLSVLQALLLAGFPGWMFGSPGPAALPPAPSGWPVTAVVCPAEFKHTKVRVQQAWSQQLKDGSGMPWLLLCDY